MNIQEVIEKNKEKTIPELFEWAETFNPENIIYNECNIDEDDEIEMYNDYEIVLSLIKRLKDNECSDKDYVDILFHIEQINYNELKIMISNG
jgi:hypothetical protein